MVEFLFEYRNSHDMQELCDSCGEKLILKSHFDVKVSLFLQFSVKSERNVGGSFYTVDIVTEKQDKIQY